MRKPPQVAVIGAGIAGLVAAIDLARQGAAVTLLERAATPGGKMRETRVGDAIFDAGPTVFTMRAVFDAIFADAGASLDSAITLRPAGLLARHAWPDGATLDLFTDPEANEAAIANFAGPAAAHGYRRFRARAQRAFRLLDEGFMRTAHPSIAQLLRHGGLRGAAILCDLAPWTSLWRRLGPDFHDPRLRQLFARYATYCGASPFLAPATLMLIAHVEQQGVWLIEGGMHRLATALARLAESHGVVLRYGCEVREILSTHHSTSGVRLASGERLAANAVVFNGEPAALAEGLLGNQATRAAPRTAMARSLSAITWSLHARTSGFSLHHHNVFFAPDYRAEFHDIFHNERLPETPTVYLCAQDHPGSTDRLAHPPTPQRLFCVVNAPARATPLTPAEIARCEQSMFSLLHRCGLTVQRPAPCQITTPDMFATSFPASCGALYGPAMHGPMAAFRRPSAQTRLRGLYLAGGSTHPGAGVPMVALSGRMAAAQLLADFASTGQFHPMATPGGISTRSAMTASMASR